MTEGFSLSKEQTLALETVMDPSIGVAILTGPAGTGKSTIIRELARRGDVSICATTGKAAMNIGGVTVDKMFGIARDRWRLFNPGYTEWAMKNAKRTILIDEASMSGEKMASLIYKTAVSYRKRIILVGDWGQASPVKEGWAFSSPLFTDARVVRLTECHRQNDSAFLRELNKVRLGIIDDDVTRLFKSREGHQRPERNFPGICMFGTNRMTDDYNSDCLSEHCAETGNWAIVGKVEVRDVRRDDKKEKKPLTEEMIAKIQEDSGLLHGGKIAIGAKVVCIRNADRESGGSYVNGTIGYVDEIIYADGRRVSEAQANMDVSEDVPPAVVDITEPNGTRHRIQRIRLVVVDAAGNAEFEALGLPLKLGYGVTIHRSQGMTVDNAWFDMESVNSFPTGSRHGLAYVALSRTRTLGGLHLSAWDPRVVECDDIVKPWL